MLLNSENSFGISLSVFPNLLRQFVTGCVAGFNFRELSSICAWEDIVLWQVKSE